MKSRTIAPLVQVFGCGILVGGLTDATAVGVFVLGAGAVLGLVGVIRS